MIKRTWWNSFERYPRWRRGLSRWRRGLSSATLTVVVVWVFAAVLQNRVDRDASYSASHFVRVVPPSPETIALWDWQRSVLQGGPYHKALKILCDLPGVMQPDVHAPDDVALPDSTIVVGIEIGGKPSAFVLDAMVIPEKHIVNTMIAQTPISVTYCDLADCVRVLKSKGDAPIDLRVGGLDIDNQLVYFLDGQHYGQRSTGIPLQDHPFTRTSLGEWKQLHPDTSVYTGDAIDLL